MKMKHQTDYPYELRPLNEDEGGGWLITFPDLPGCMSDGETPEEAIKNGEDALHGWIAAVKEEGRKVPAPSESLSGKFVTRIPKSMHARLVSRAKQEGVSMNALVTAFIAECLGRQHK
jgi:antitoxin HicB